MGDLACCNAGHQYHINNCDIDEHHPDHHDMDNHHPDHLGVLLRDGVKDMGDLAERDSQSIRPIHPNLLFQSWWSSCWWWRWGQWSWRWWRWSSIVPVNRSKLTFLFVGQNAINTLCSGRKQYNAGNSRNTLEEIQLEGTIQIGNNAELARQTIEGSTIWRRRRLLITHTYNTPIFLPLVLSQVF